MTVVVNLNMKRGQIHEKGAVNEKIHSSLPLQAY